MTAMARPALLYFLLWLGVTLSSAMNLEKRIFFTCDKDERHYHVKLIPKDTAGKEYTCGGSLIRDQWVLTAAHCLEPGWTLKAIVNFHPGDKREEMTIDTSDQGCIQKEPGDHDIMLVKLPQKPGGYHQTVKLPTQDDCNNKDIKVGEKYQMSGYIHGKDPKSGVKVLLSSNHQLQCATLTAAACKGRVPKCLSHIPQKNWICGEGNNVDTGGGDSGSGAVKDNVIYGVYSNGGDYPCDISAFALRVCPYLVWINTTAI